MQHEKRACHVKCTLYTEGQEATKTNGTTLAESRGKDDLRTAWIYPRPSGSTAYHGGRFRSIPHGVVGVILPFRWTFVGLLQTDLFITRLRFAEPVTITFPQFLPGPVPGTSSRPDKSASTARQPIGICQTAVPREPFTILRTRVRSPLRTLEFWLSVRLKGGSSRRTQPVVNRTRCS